MNSHFQSSATTSTVSGSGRRRSALRIDAVQRPIGVERWVLIQVSAPREMMIISGAAQITSSSWVEWSHSGS